MKLIHLKEGKRMFLRSMRVRRKGFVRHGKQSEKICETIVRKCWNGKYFQTSLGHFSQFYTRDFGFCTDSLIRLGYKEWVKQTLDHVLKTFTIGGAVTTSISPDGMPFDFPYYGIDSLAWLLHSLVVSKSSRLVHGHKEFLERELSKVATLLDEDGLVRPEVALSSMKDHVKRKSSCYDACMLAHIKTCATKLKLHHELSANYKELLMTKYWIEDEGYFREDRTDATHFAADANILPFWLGIITDKKLWNQVHEKLCSEQLNVPLPVKYSMHKHGKASHLAAKIVPDYEGDAIWAHLGMMYMQLIEDSHPEQYAELHEQYENVIEKYGTFLEVYDSTGLPFKSPVYITDEGMLWASMFIA
jgi:hypothetical protein